MRLINGLRTNPESRAVYRSATAKCSSLWTKFSHSTIAAECVEEVSDKKLIVPTVTRWNSFYDAQGSQKCLSLTLIISAHSFKCMNDREYQFLKEYCAIMKPFTAALDTLQGRGDLFLWHTSTYFRDSYGQNLSDEKWSITNDHWAAWGYCGSYQNSICCNNWLKAALLASVSLPKFKLCWVKEETRRDLITLLLTTECHTLTTEEPDARSPSTYCCCPK